MNMNKAKAVCRALPGAVLDIKWGDNQVYSVGEKMFAMIQEGRDNDTDGISFKVDDERFLELTDRPGIIPAPYLARARWVKVVNLKALDDAEAAALLKRAHALVFARLTKKLQREIEGSTSWPLR